MRLDSKWSYLLSGVNIGIAVFGALLHNLPLVLSGGFFGFWNWAVAEANRRIEDESIRQEGKSESDIETEE